MSLPTRECGLKLSVTAATILSALVTPHTGVWIEMSGTGNQAGFRQDVTPHTGVWIEIVKWVSIFSADTRHSPHGSVD